MGTTPALCHADLFEPYRVFLERSEFGPLVGVTVPAWRRGPVPLARAVARRVVWTMRGQSAGSRSSR
jgi:hypothetical protein